MFIGQLGRRGFATGGVGTFESAAAEFRARRHLRLDRFIEPALLEDWRRRLAVAPFRSREYAAEKWNDKPPTDLVVEDRALLRGFEFSMHDGRLFRAIQAIAGCAEIRSFEPVIYRMTPGHSDQWHDDLPTGQERLVTFSLNMSADGYTGGTLDFAEAGSLTPLFTVENPEPGGALIFELSPSLVHRVAPVRSGARTVFAGWFSSRAPVGFPGR